MATTVAEAKRILQGRTYRIERDVKDAVKAVLKAHKVYYFMPVSNGMGVMGVFDIVCCFKGVFVGIECKLDGTKKPTPLQTINATRCMTGGGIALLIHSGNIQELENTLLRISEEHHELSVPSVWPTSST